MMHNYKSLTGITLVFLLVFSLEAQSTVSKDIYLEAGEKTNRKVSSVSGDITIGQKVEIANDVSTVSGDIEIGPRSKVEDVETVSGDIAVAKGAQVGKLESVSGDIELYGNNRVDGRIKTVSGDVNAQTGSDIHSDIETVSGDIEMDDTRVRGDLATTSGDISLFNGTFVDGSIFIHRKKNPMQMKMGKLEITVDLNSVVKGSIIVDEDDTNVVVYLSNGGKVEGEVVNAKLIRQ